MELRTSDPGGVVRHSDSAFMETAMASLDAHPRTTGFDLGLRRLPGRAVRAPVEPAFGITQPLSVRRTENSRSPGTPILPAQARRLLRMTNCH